MMMPSAMDCAVMEVSSTIATSWPYTESKTLYGSDSNAATTSFIRHSSASAVTKLSVTRHSVSVIESTSERLRVSERRRANKQS